MHKIQRKEPVQQAVKELRDMKSYKGRTVAKGQLVEVYRNLNNGYLSIRDYKTKKVLAHAINVELQGVTFKVHQKGRERVLNEKRKNVHAFAIGRYMGNPERFTGQTRVTYNPYKFKSFVNADNFAPIHKADYAFLAAEGTIIIP